jgi:hypothetical protein
MFFTCAFARGTVLVYNTLSLSELEDGLFNQLYTKSKGVVEGVNYQLTSFQFKIDTNLAILLTFTLYTQDYDVNVDVSSTVRTSFDQKGNMLVDFELMDKRILSDEDGTMDAEDRDYVLEKIVKIVNNEAEMMLIQKISEKLVLLYLRSFDFEGELTFSPPEIVFMNNELHIGIEWK